MLSMKSRFIVRLILALVVAALARDLTAESQAVPIDELPELRAILDSTGFTGTVLVYDLTKDKYSAIGSAAAGRGHIPASTFKIFNALVALETGVVTDATTIIKWDGVTRERAELNRDRDLATAFRLSAVPHFQLLARSIGAVRMQHYVDAVEERGEQGAQVLLQVLRGGAPGGLAQALAEVFQNVLVDHAHEPSTRCAPLWGAPLCALHLPCALQRNNPSVCSASN